MEHRDRNRTTQVDDVTKNGTQTEKQNDRGGSGDTARNIHRCRMTEVDQEEEEQNERWLRYNAGWNMWNGVE